LGHKVNPNGFRLGVIRGWESRWYANRNYKDLLAEDLRIRRLINKRLANAAVARIEIERVANQISITIHTAKPGIVIGKSGEAVERLKVMLEDATKKKVRLNILEIRNPEVDATLVARSIAEQLEKRVSFRRAMKQAVQKSMRAGAKGIKVVVGGRLGGAEIARTEKEVEGSVPLQTLRANIDYALAEAHTTYGVIGVKVWIYHGDVLPERQRAEGLGAGAPAAVPAGAGERPMRPERPERRGGGERGGAERGGGERGPRTPRRPATGTGAAPERGTRTPRAAGGTAGQPGAAPARERAPRAPRAAQPEPQPSGEITPEAGPTLPAAAAAETTREQTAEAQTKPEPAAEAPATPEPTEEAES
jgi:small subunit ribosomal protein S3